MKFRYKVLLAIVVVCLIELTVFHLEEIPLAVNRDIEKNIEIDASDITYINWKKEQGVWITESDPQIFISPNIYVGELEISLQLSKEIPFIVIYYKTDLTQEFSDTRMVFTEQVQEKNVLSLNETVTELRIDLGDDAGVAVEDINIILNPLQLKFSFSRFFAMMFIYLAATGLFQCTKSPNYFNKEESDNKR